MVPIFDDEVVERLARLIQLDIDAIHAYDSAIEKIDIQDVKNKLVEFRADHERHVSDLSPILRSRGGIVPELKPDFKGFIIQGFTALRSVTGTPGALKAMRGNEELTNRVYEKALAADLPSEVKPVIERNLEDERRHLAYIVQCIEEKVWEIQKIA